MEETQKRATCYGGEAGASVVIALAVMVFVSVVAAAVAMYAQVSYSAAEDYRIQRAERYGADGAVNAAVNWVRNQPKAGLDPALGDPGAVDCVYHVPATETTPAITVTCEADAGGGSGQPAETGLVPPQAMVLLGQRYGEPQRNSPCSGGPEVGIRMNSATPNRGSAGCHSSGVVDGFRVKGDVYSNAPIVVDEGQFEVDGEVRAGTSRRFSNLPCPTGRVSATGGCQALSTQRARSASGGPAHSPWDPGEQLVSDPRSADPAAWPRGEIVWTKGEVAVNDSARVPVANVSSVINLCNSVPVGTQVILRFFPGWYDDANALNQIFNATPCNRGGAGIFWFQPAAGDDGSNPSQDPLTEHAKQGVYLFDFRNSGEGTPCGNYENSNNPHRWCAADFSENGPRVVGGWPKGWEPGTVTSNPSEPTYVEMTRANRIEGAFLSGWQNQPGAAVMDDGSTARYSTWLPSFTDRRLTLGNFSPQVASGGANREVKVSVRHKETGNANVGQIWMRIRTKEVDGRTLDCGNFYVPRTSNTWETHVVATADLDTPDAQRLRTCVATPHRANNLEVNWHLEGTWNSWSGSVAELDGVKISIESQVDDWFGDDVDVDKEAVYCDDTKPGVQFVFGGDSSLHAAGSTVHVCAGPTDENPQVHQQIAIWGEPGTSVLKASTAQSLGGDGSVNDTARMIKAGDPYWENSNNDGAPTGRFDFSPGFFDMRELRARVSGFDRVSTTANCDRRTTVCLDPATQRITKVELKAATDTDCGGQQFGLCWGLAASPRYKVTNANGSSTYCGNTDLAAANGITWQTADITNCLALGDGTNLSRLHDLAIEWTARCSAGCIPVARPAYVDHLEGLELHITIGPKTPGAQTVLPATGCRYSVQGYGSGMGDPGAVYDSDRHGRDCALISGGRISVKGTIYAPTDALEISDGNALYPFASRGLVARHLRVRRYAADDRYIGDAVSNEIDTDYRFREMTFVACARSSPSSETCGSKSGDRVLTTARVVFDKNDVPSVERWEMLR